jgi:hypothetical protein
MKTKDVPIEFTKFLFNLKAHGHLGNPEIVDRITQIVTFCPNGHVKK